MVGVIVLVVAPPGLHDQVKLFEPPDALPVKVTAVPEQTLVLLGVIFTVIVGQLNNTK